MELLELKQRKFERTAGNLEPRLLQKMVSWCSGVGCWWMLVRISLVKVKKGHCKWVWYGAVQCSEDVAWHWLRSGTWYSFTLAGSLLPGRGETCTNVPRHPRGQSGRWAWEVGIFFVRLIVPFLVLVLLHIILSFQGSLTKRPTKQLWACTWRPGSVQYWPYLSNIRHTKLRPTRNNVGSQLNFSPVKRNFTRILSLHPWQIPCLGLKVDRTF